MCDLVTGLFLDLTSVLAFFEIDFISALAEWLAINKALL